MQKPALHRKTLWIVLTLLALAALAWLAMRKPAQLASTATVTTGPLEAGFQEIQQFDQQKVQADGMKAQELGSWITYGRRYCLGAVVGVAPDEDDDGNAAKSTVAPRRRESADTVAAAVEAIGQAADAAALDKLEALTKQRGIDGIAAVKTAVAARRAAVGEVPADEKADPWAAES